MAPPNPHVGPINPALTWRTSLAKKLLDDVDPRQAKAVAAKFADARLAARRESPPGIRPNVWPAGCGDAGQKKSRGGIRRKHRSRYERRERSEEIEVPPPPPQLYLKPVAPPAPTSPKKGAEVTLGLRSRSAVELRVNSVQRVALDPLRGPPSPALEGPPEQRELLGGMKRISSEVAFVPGSPSAAPAASISARRRRGDAARAISPLPPPTGGAAPSRPARGRVAVVEAPSAAGDGPDRFSPRRRRVALEQQGPESRLAAAAHKVTAIGALTGGQGQKSEKAADKSNNLATGPKDKSASKSPVPSGRQTRDGSKATSEAKASEFGATDSESSDDSGLSESDMPPPPLHHNMRRLSRAAFDNSFGNVVMAWRGVFEHYQDDREIHQDHLAAALQMLGFAEVDKTWVGELVADLTRFSTLNMMEFEMFVSNYEQRFSEDTTALFARFAGDGSGHMKIEEVSNLLQARGLTAMNYVIVEVLEEVGAGIAVGGWQLRPMHFLQMVDNLRERELFSKAEVKELKHAFKKFDGSGRGFVHQADIRHVFIFLGLSTTCAEAGQAMLAGDPSSPTGSPSYSTGVSQREFMVLARRVREMEIEIIKKKLAMTVTAGLSPIGQLLEVWRELGYVAEEADIADAAFDASVRINKLLELGQAMQVLLAFRKREGFCNQEIQSLKDHFNLGDEDNSGELDVIEVAKVLRKLGYPVTCDAAQMLVARVDADLSGALDIREFMKLVRIYKEMCNQRAKSVFLENLPSQGDGCSQTMAARNAAQAFDQIAKLEGLGTIAPHLLEGLGIAQGGGKGSMSRQVSGVSSTGTRRGQSVHIDIFGFLSTVNNWRQEERVLRTERCGFGDQETHDLLCRFRAVARHEEKEGQTERVRVTVKALQRTLADLYPELAKRADLRPKFRDLLREAEDHAELTSDGTDFHGFLKLASGCRELLEQEQLRREKQTVTDLGFQLREVEEFRELFLQQGRTVLTLEEVTDMLSGVVPMGHYNSQQLAAIFNQVGSQKSSGRTDLDFPEFLQLIRRCMDVNLGKLTERCEQNSGLSPRRRSPGTLS